jgi:hypothetical protein
MAPPGTRVLVHEKPGKRGTWAPHATDGWYTAPAIDSYRCYQIWMWETRAMRICDTLTWFPTKVTMPSATTEDRILASLRDITDALRNPTHGAPLSPTSDTQQEALAQLIALLHNTLAPATHETEQPVQQPDDPSAPHNLSPIPKQSPPPLRVPIVPPSPTPPPSMPNPGPSAPSLRVTVPPAPLISTTQLPTRILNPPTAPLVFPQA